MPRFFLQVSYDGTAFHGSQMQGDTPTVQLALNQALSMVLRRPVETFGASRTDEGVHAIGNIYHIDLADEPRPDFRYRLNAVLPDAVGISAVYRALNPEMNARFDATSRQYRYRIYKQKNPFLRNRALHFPYRVNKEVLQQTAEILKEYTDFETFCKRNSQTHTFRCTIMESHWLETADELQYVVKANRFLRGMVRGLVGTQLQVARGKMSVAEFRNVIEAKDCTRARFDVAGFGLYLEDITYPEGSLELVRDDRW